VTQIEATTTGPLIYVDTSVVLAQLLAEDRHPPTSFWYQDGLIASRLLEYEAWTRINGRGLGESHGDHLRALLGLLSFLELAPPILTRALEPFPVPVRTLDALHLASIAFLVGLGQRPSLVTYNFRLAAAAGALGVPVIHPDGPGDSASQLG
jgi:hypothetical protein